MSWDQHDTQRGRWRTCQDCGQAYSDRIAHMRTHIDRPSDNHMTTAEVAEVVGRPVRTVSHWIRKGWLKAEKKVRGSLNRRWVTRKSLKAFVEGELSGDLRKVVKWAEDGKVVTGG